MRKNIGIFLASSLALSAATLQVGPDRTFQTPCAAVAVASDGDVIEIDAGLYKRDVCVIPQNNLTLRGVNGRAHLEAGDASAQGKAIWVIQGNDARVENIEFSGASVPDQNGAGIRAEGVNWTVRNCYFHDNQDGILESNIAGSNILIEFSEFDHNGFSTGQAHNLYIGHTGSLTFQFNWSHRAKAGHLLKSRASQNYIYFNRLTDETGTASYEIDLPNGGSSYVIGNLIEQGKNTGNRTILTYLEEGISSLTSGADLHVINNTFVNDLRDPLSNFVRLGSGASSALITNNIFNGPGVICELQQSGTACDATAATLTANFIGDPLFVNATNFDYHLTATSPAIDQGSDVGSLTPLFEYVHPACGEQRIMSGAAIDIGAYEFGGAGRPLTCR